MLLLWELLYTECSQAGPRDVVFSRLLAICDVSKRRGYVQFLWARGGIQPIFCVCALFDLSVLPRALVPALPDLLVPLCNEKDSAGYGGHRRFFLCTVHILLLNQRMYFTNRDIYLLYAFCTKMSVILVYKMVRNIFFWLALFMFPRFTPCTGLSS